MKKKRNLKSSQEFLFDKQHLEKKALPMVFYYEPYKVLIVLIYKRLGNQFMHNIEKMVKHTFKILECVQCNNFKSIFNHF